MKRSQVIENLESYFRGFEDPKTLARHVLEIVQEAGMLMPPIYKDDYTGTDEEFWSKAEELFGVWEWEKEDTP